MAERGIETDFPKGHPARHDYDPTSPEAQEWLRVNVHPMGERAFPVDHPAAVDTPGNMNSVEWQPGIDPRNPHREAFSGRTPEQAAGVRALSAAASNAAKESPVMKPLDALEVAKAMNAKRKKVGRDVLTAAEYESVLAALQARA
jgi:hypothetical protein